MQKNHLILVIALLALSFAAYIYFNPPGRNNSITITKKDTVFLNKPTGDKNVCMDYSSYSPSTLTAGLIRDMTHNYQVNQLSSIKGSTLNPMADDAHSIWFAIDTVKKFIYDIEQGVKQHSTVSNNKLGIRIYYAAYPLKSTWADPKYGGALTAFLGNAVTEQYEKMHTLVMLPTILNSAGVTADFNPSDVSTYNGFINSKSGDNGYKSPLYHVMGVTAVPDNTGNTDARNHGQLIPPGDPSGTVF